MPRGQDQALAGLVEKALLQSDLTPKDLTALAVTNGPGSFTGIRVGLSFARAMAAVLKIPLIGLTTMDVLIKEIEGTGAAIIEIKKDAYIVQKFTGNRPDTNMIAVDQAGLLKFITDHSIKNAVSHSEGVAKNLQKFSDVACLVAHPKPSIMLDISQMRLLEGVNDTVVRPVYMRQADVTVKK